jgi:hypothetical protein
MLLLELQDFIEGKRYESYIKLTIQTNCFTGFAGPGGSQLNGNCSFPLLPPSVGDDMFAAVPFLPPSSSRNSMLYYTRLSNAIFSNFGCCRLASLLGCGQVVTS